MLNNFKARIGTNLGSYTVDSSNNTLVIGNDYPFTVEKDAFLYIYNKTQNKYLYSINPYSDKVSSIVGNNININPADCSLGSSDLVDIYVSIPPLFVDTGLDVLKTVVQNSIPPYNTDLFQIASAAAVDDAATASTWVGNYELDVTGYSQLGLFISYTKGTTVGAQLRIVTITATGATTYYDFEDTQMNYRDLDESAATTYRFYNFDVSGLQFIVLQTRGGTTVGTGTITIDVKLSNY